MKKKKLWIFIFGYVLNRLLEWPIDSMGRTRLLDGPGPFTRQSIEYCTAHEGWDVTGYQGLFCPSNKPSCDRLPGGVQLVKTGGRRVFVVKSGHLYLENRGNS